MAKGSFTVAIVLLFCQMRMKIRATGKVPLSFLIGNQVSAVEEKVEINPWPHRVHLATGLLTARRPMEHHAHLHP